MKMMELSNAINFISKERKIPKESIENAMVKAFESMIYKKFGVVSADVSYNENKGISVIFWKRVVSKVTNKQTELSLEQAQKEYPNEKIVLGDEIGVELDDKELQFSRKEIQSILHLITQKNSFAESEALVKQFKSKEGSLVKGVVTQKNNYDYTVKIGSDTMATINQRDFMPNDVVGNGVQFDFIIEKVSRENKGSIHLSRNNHLLVYRLLEKEIPEVEDGKITIKRMARITGYKTKILVESNDSHVDALRTCLGDKGYKIQMISEKLSGEIIELYDNESSLLKDNLKKINAQYSFEDSGIFIYLDEEDIGKFLGKRKGNALLVASLLNKNLFIVNNRKVKENIVLARKELSQLPISILEIEELIQKNIYSLDLVKKHNKELSFLKNYNNLLDNINNLNKENFQDTVECILEPKEFKLPKVIRSKEEIVASIRTSLNFK